MASKKIRNAFDTFDLDNNGYVGAKEIKHLLAVIGESVPNHVVDEMVRMCSQEGHGMADYEGFARLSQKRMMLFNTQPLRPATGEVSGGDSPTLGVTDTVQPAAAQNLAMQITSGEDLLLAQAGGSSANLDDLIHQFTGGAKMKPSFLKKLYQKMPQVDVQNTGELTYEMFCRVFETPPSPLMEKLFEAFDADNSKSVDLKELVVGLSRYTSASKQDKLKFAFMMFDEDGNGTIDRDELKKIITANFIQERMKESEVEARVLKVYERMNVPVGTAISYEMFMNMHKKDASCLFPQQQVQVGYVKDSKADAKLQKMKSGISQTGASSAS